MRWILLILLLSSLIGFLSSRSDEPRKITGWEMGSARTYPERTRLGDDGIYPACWANFKGGPPQEP